MITLNKVTLQRGTKTLLQQASVAIFAKQKIGLVGKNGSGKSSLFDLILGKLEPDKGDLEIQSNIKITHLSQSIPNTEIAAIEYVMQGDQETSAIFERLKKAEKNGQYDLVCQLHEKLYELDGYALKSKAGKILNGLGFQADEHEKPVNDFSGGWKMRLNLAQTLIERSDLMLLDEPTNHLDLDAIIWLEKWLKDYPGTLMVISHDREFLDHVVSRILHIEQQTLNSYTGNYSDFEDQRALKLAQQQAHFVQQQKKLKHINRFIDRFRYKATKAKQVQSRIKALERMEQVSEVHRESPFQFEFKPAKKCGAPLIKIDDVTLGYDEKIVLRHIIFQIDPGDRIGLLGHNGAGKSTLMKCLSGKLLPLSGHIFRNPALSIGYFAQELVEQLNFDQSPLQHLQNIDPKATISTLRNFLGGFNFSGDMALSKITHFSGGEKARLVLALIVWQTPCLLILDEPTNHLDLEMREALTLALQNYEGALILVSHDRHLLKTSVEQLYLVNNQSVEEFTGDVDDYAQWVLENKKERSETRTNDEYKKTNDLPNTQKQNELKKIEQRLEKCYQEKTKLEKILANPDMYLPQHAEQLKQLLKQLSDLKKQINLLEETWLM
ncbi:MAG: ATP-binding cassette domain-containing protein [Gammaproteobacteria bacterium]|nr:ATP-binding cassette domain-containing protein [Gammaproteobacteria bacterium]